MTRPAVTLSREMKILLTALGLVALLGGWMVLNNRQTDDTTVIQPPASSAKPAPAAGSGNAGGANAGSGETPVQGNAVDNGAVTPITPDAAGGTAPGVQLGSTGKTEVATVPPFPVTGPNGTTPDPTIVAAVPRGINPNQPLNSLNGNNPFKPVRIEAKGGTPAGTLAGGASAAGNDTGTGAVTITRPSTPPSAIDSALGSSSTGALAISPIAGADTSSSRSGFGGSSESGSTSGRSTGNSGLTTTFDAGGANASGAFPAPTIPGAPADSGVTVVGASPAPAGSNNLPTTTIKVPGSGTGNSGANGSSLPGASSPSAPVRPPVAGVREPGTVNVPGVGVAGSKGGSAGTGNTGAATPSGDLGNPSVMTDLGLSTEASSGSAPSAGNASGVSSLDAAINEHQLVFDAAVLGPVNTAVFRSDKGYVVATVGDTIPNTNIVLKEVTANSATLAVGNDKKILELDKR